MVADEVALADTEDPGVVVLTVVAAVGLLAGDVVCGTPSIQSVQRQTVFDRLSKCGSKQFRWKLLVQVPHFTTHI